MHVDNQDTSGLFQGKYTQDLRWRKGGAFDLVARSREGKSKTELPDYYSRGRDVLEVLPNGDTRNSPSLPAAGTAAGWEVSSGYILSWLQGTHYADDVFSDRVGQAVSWKFGPRATWHAMNCRELILYIDGKPASSLTSIFVDARQKTLLGLETHITKKLGWALYSKQQFNSALPANVGKPPQ